MICILRVVEGPAKGMKCWLSKDQRLTIGRQSSTDFSIPADLHMSRSHLMVEGLATSFRIRDAGSSNGTYVNDFPITAIELCDGDLIKAGSTVFKVDLQLDEAAPIKDSIAFGEESVGFIPTRTLNADNLSSDQDTMRYTLDSLIERSSEAPPASYAPASDPEDNTPAEVAKKPATAEKREPKQASGSPVDGKSSVPAAVEASTLIPSAFLAGFTQSEKSRLLWRQAAEAAMWEPIRLIDCLMAAPSRFYLSLIVNRSQLDAAQFATLDFDTTAGKYRALTETLYILESHNLEAVLEFYKTCLTKDAAVCIASAKPLSDHWLHDAIDILSYPSMLFELLSKSPDRTEQLARKVLFVMFEPNTQGELCLLCSAD